VQLSDNVPAGQKPDVARIPPRASAVVGVKIATAAITAKIAIAMVFMRVSSR
jgi:hypothetical protein